MIGDVIAALVALAENGSSIEEDAETLFNDIAHGVGGVAKIDKVIDDLETLLSVAKTVAGSL